MTYVLVSDLHCHTWSQFSKTNPDGVNGRLRIILNELLRAAEVGRKSGAKAMVVAGDIFHIRGSIDPEVLNPVQETFGKILDLGLDIYAIPGNHDLKSRDTNELSSAIQTLSQTFNPNASIRIFNEPGSVRMGNYGIAFVPWCADIPTLLEKIADLAIDVNRPEEYDLIIHAGIDGVIPGLPDHGLSPADLQAFGFRTVYAGHYHHRKEVARGVWSIGSLTHQTWGDVDTDSGFIVVSDIGTHIAYPDQAPRFVDVSTMTLDDAKFAAINNYVRFRGPPLTPDEANDMRDLFIKAGALGVSIQSPRVAASARAMTAKQTKAMTVDQSVLAYVDAKSDFSNLIDKNEVKKRCLDVLHTVRAVEA